MEQEMATISVTSAPPHERASTAARARWGPPGSCVAGRGRQPLGVEARHGYGGVVEGDGGGQLELELRDDSVAELHGAWNKGYNFMK